VLAGWLFCGFPFRRMLSAFIYSDWSVLYDSSRPALHTLFFLLYCVICTHSSIRYPTIRCGVIEWWSQSRSSVRAHCSAMQRERGMKTIYIFSVIRCRFQMSSKFTDFSSPTRLFSFHHSNSLTPPLISTATLVYHICNLSGDDANNTLMRTDYRYGTSPRWRIMS
jgi:hypothetical protein